MWSLGRPAEKKLIYLSGVLTLLFSFLLIVTLSELFFRTRTAYIPRQVMNALPNRGEYLRTDTFVFDDAPIQVGRRFHPNQNAPITGQAREILAWNGIGRFFYLPEPETINVHFITDENGYRNVPPLAEEYSIAVAGDSLTVGMEVETPWPELLTQATGQSVLNLASVGYSPQAEVAAMRLYGLDKSPDTIIMAYFEGNDLRDALNYAEIRKNNQSFAQHLADDAPWNRQLVTLTYLRLLAADFAGLFGLRNEPERPAQNETAVYPAEVTINGREMALTFLDGYVAMLAAQQSEIERSENWQAVTAAFLEMQQLAEENGARLILVYLPSKPHVYLPLMPAETAEAIVSTAGRTRFEDGRIIPDTISAGLAFDDFMAHIDDQALAVAGFAESHDIEFLNLTPAFQAEAAQGEILYFSLSTHWNPAGHQLAAQEVAAYLAAAP
jgi:hypothetical protein